jgi:hypothetical protein
VKQLLQCWRISSSKASGVHVMLVMKRCLTLLLHLRVVLVVIGSTIHALPGPAFLAVI